jgi:hypothetical protein
MYSRIVCTPTDGQFRDRCFADRAGVLWQLSGSGTEGCEQLMSRHPHWESW